MSKKSKGTNAERELVHLFWNTNEWSAVRVAGSGSMKFPSPDILAGNSIRRLAIECKATKANHQYITKKEYEELKVFSHIFGAEAWIAVRFDKDRWYFINLEDLTDSGKNYSISKQGAKLKGLLFDEFIGRFKQSRVDEY